MILYWGAGVVMINPWTDVPLLDTGFNYIQVAAILVSAVMLIVGLIMLEDPRGKYAGELLLILIAIFTTVSIIIFMGGVILELVSPSETLPGFKECAECHTNLNATENITACETCNKIWSNVYT